MKRKVVLTGMRTTGSLHLGHYVGALKMWKEIQDAGQHECFFLLADVQALTTHADRPELLTKSVLEVTKDWLAVGLDPSLPYVHFVLQSQVSERYELSALFMMIARYNEVMRNPTLKTELEKQPTASMGFMNYPVDQAADIFMVSPFPVHPENEILIPVGDDQIPHIEFANSLGARFNRDYGPVFPPCKPMIGKFGRFVGTDGKAKMSKSLGNSILLSDSAEAVERKVKSMYTDSKHLRIADPGDAENNPVFIYLRAFDPNPAEVEALAKQYEKGGLGDTVLKQRLVKVLNDFLEPIRQRRAQFEHADLGTILREGTQVAKEVCSPVVSAVREYMALKFP